MYAGVHIQYHMFTADPTAVTHATKAAEMTQGRACVNPHRSPPQRHEWFVASEILSRSNKLSTQPRGGLNVYCVSRHLKTLEGRGLIESDGFQNGRKRYRRL